MVMFIMLSKVVLRFEPVDQILKYMLLNSFFFNRSFLIPFLILRYKTFLECLVEIIKCDH